MVQKSVSLDCRKHLLLVLLAISALNFSFAQNSIITENALTGNPSTEWDVSGAGDLSIQGFGTDISANKGASISFKIDVNSGTNKSFGIKIYRLGYYNGNGARLVADLGSFTGIAQNQCGYDNQTGLMDCGNWTTTATWAIPATAVSGLYIAKLTRSAAGGGGASHIAFIVRDDAANSPMLFKTSDATWQAYNVYGGNSLYVGTTSYPAGHAAKVSYNRPYITRNGGGGGGVAQDWLFNAEYPMIRFLERNGYNMSYSTDVDMDRTAAAITPAVHKILLSVGHDEYWSATERTKFENARAAGVHQAYFSGNEVYWKTRWENNNRTLVCYKEGTLGENVTGTKSDPLSTSWTGLWRDGCSYPSADGCRPENALTGEISWAENTAPITVPAAYKALRFWRNTSVASLAAGQTATLADGTIGYEWDWEQYADSYPNGRITMSSTTIDSKTHKLSLYKHASGALVFGAGTIQWSWGLDNKHDNGTGAVSVAMQQATVNLFADMGVQPGSLQAGLVAATSSTDLTAPVAAITAPANNASVAANSTVTISGTASDAGGVLAGVEVSVDGGSTWKPATGTSSWSYTWVPAAAGTISLKARGFDDSGNIGVPGGTAATGSITVTVTAGTSACPCSIFQPGASPSVQLENDGQAIEVGVKFRSTQNGFITGIRFYKGSGNSGTHIGHLWSSTGTKLGEATFSGETSSGWQQVLFSSPVAITAGTTYVASYFSSSGAYSYTNPSLTAAVVNGPLSALANGTDGPNGLYIYTAASAFPTSNYQTSNYFVDVVFNTTAGADITPPTVSSVSPANAATGVGISTGVTATFNEAISAASVTTTSYSLKNAANTVIASMVSVSGSQILLTPAATLSSSTVYTVIIKGGSTGVKDAAGNALAADYSWSFTTGASDLTPPTVSSVSPASAATGVSVSTAVSAIMSEAISSASVTTASFTLKNGAGTAITATVSTASNQITLTPSAALAASTAYTVVIKGGSTGVKDLAGNALAADYTWSFTTGTVSTTTATVFKSTDVPATPYTTDGQPLEVGFKFRATVAGYITGIRFYKGTGNTGTHIGHLWSSTGTKLGEATFTGESASGWQQILFGSPVAIAANTTYVASYFSSGGGYAITNPYFTSAVVNGSLRGLANGEDGPNGLYIYTAASAFPTGNFQSSNYWVDVVFSSSAGPDVTPPVVSSVSPVNAGTGVSNSSTVSANFNEPVNASTVTSTSFQLKDAGNNVVAATLATAAGQITLTPSAVLTYSATYTATIKGGASGVKDLAGNALAADYTWSFTIGDAPAPPATDGAGGPILIVSSTANPFSRYAIEILRAEGLNGFLAKDISQVTAADLNNYDVVILGEQSVNSTQATMFTNWVNAGGTLIGFRPSTTLSGLFGITKGTGTLSDQYLLVNTASGPGAGIVAQTIQFHGAADLYTLSGAASLATLYSNATTATTNPAITSMAVGSNGGLAIAFTYDLAKSIVYTRQGNPAWSGQKRDGAIDPIRSDDMFFGGTSPDWIDFNKVAIPQADEQQHLLTNIILQGNLHRKPLPKFWFLPRGLKAAIVMTGDDHANNGTVGRFNQYLTLGPNTATDVADWKAVRGTSYIYTGTPITNAQAVSFQSQGFEIALHPTTGCDNYSLTSLQDNFTTQLSTFKSQYPGLSAPVTNRTHCLVWSDWSSTPKVELLNGERLDATYYYWPAEWIQNRPGMFTGSGMPMRFADTDGTLIDVYQAVTQMTDESGITVGPFCDALLDKALGTEGYYGVFTANMHTDTANHTGSNAIIASAQARQVPVISSKQLLTWLDGRNGSSFGAMTWSNNQLTFPVTALTGARNLNGMLPVNSANGQLASITINGSALSFTTQTIKGMQYAFFNIAAGTNSYVATYSGGTATAPTVTTHPVNQTVCSGTSVTFSSVANGTPAPSTQWQQSTNGTTWANITGAVNSNYTFSPAVADNAKQFRAVWTNASGFVNSNAATLTVNAIPVAPTVTVANNCGNSVLTAGGFTGSLLWSNLATTPAITVTTAATYTVTQTVNGCASTTGSGIAAPNTAAVLSSSLTAAANTGTAFTYTATSSTAGTSFSWSRAAVTGISNAASSGTGNISETLVNTSAGPLNVTYVYTLSANGCTNSQNVVVTVSAAVASGACGITATSITSTFNSTAIAAGRYIWFNAVFDPSTLGSTGTVNFNVTNARITFTAGGTAYSLPVPNSHIQFSSSVASATTTFVNNVWETQAPLSFSGNVFFGGLSYLVPARIAGSLTNIKWVADISIDKPAVSVTWKWSAAVYSTFAANSGITVKPLDGLVQNPYLNSDKGGTPENFKTRLVSGAKGNGGTNYTGNYTNATTVTCTTGSRLLVAEAVLPSLIEDAQAANNLSAFPLSVKALPNPTTEHFELVIRSNNNAPVTVILRDIFGRVLQKREKIGSNITLQFGQNWIGGTYFAEVIQGDERKMVKMIKIN